MNARGWIHRAGGIGAESHEKGINPSRFVKLRHGKGSYLENVNKRRS
jgi:hypothetical protein